MKEWTTMEENFSFRSFKEESKRKLLIVDDVNVNRAILKKIFKVEYEVIEAENGVQALEMLKLYKDVSAVILDIVMPVMDGFEVLEIMKKDSLFSLIPVIVVSSESDEKIQIKALELGARDVIGKPYNAEVVKHRVSNIILSIDSIRANEKNKCYFAELAMREKELFQSQHDMLTGLFNRNAFIIKAQGLIEKNPVNSFIISCLDIDGFKVVNDRFGHDEGDRFLKYAGKKFESTVENAGGIICRDMADIFLFLLPNDKKLIFSVAKKFFDSLKNYDLPMNIDLHIGIYEVDDIGLAVNRMIDRAMLAVRSVKGSANVHVGFFDEEMRKKVLREQELINDMRMGLSENQFEVYFQPQFDYEIKSIIGAEALVRWNHPIKGMISPGEFIDLFEKNGFISALDEYVLELVCKYLRKWIDMGLNPFPVSVNISRRDIRNDMLPELLTALAEKYDIAHELLHFEITESAYTDQPKQLLQVITELQNRGFIVEMDDFGKGFSSLNSLKDVPVDILKLDMNFVNESNMNTRGGNILSSMVRMAHWLKLPVIAEGVENFKQAEYLKSIGCRIMQGYYFFKPMPLENYERILIENKNGKPSSFFDFEDKNINSAVDFLDISTQEALLFNSFVGGAFIAEFDGKILEVLRINEHFFEILGYSRKEYFENQLDILSFLYPESKDKLIEALKEAILTKVETKCEICLFPFKNKGSDKWTMNRVRFLALNHGKAIFYISVENITNRKLLEQKLAVESHKNAALIANIPGGVIMLSQISGKIGYEYFSEGICRMLGYNYSEMKRFAKNVFLDLIHPNDRKRIKREILDSFKSLEEFKHDYLLKCKDQKYIWVNITGNPVCCDNNMVEFYCTLINIEEHISYEKNLQLEKQKTEVALEFSNVSIWEYNMEAKTMTMLNVREGGSLPSKMDNVPFSLIENGYIDKDSAEEYIRLHKCVESGEDGACANIFMQSYNGKGKKWYRVTYRTVSTPGKSAIAIGTAVNIDAEIKSVQKQDKVISNLKLTERLMQIMAKHSKKYLIIYDFETDTIKPYGNNINCMENALPLYSKPLTYIEKNVISQESVNNFIKAYAELKNKKNDVFVKIRAKTIKGEWSWFNCMISIVYDESEKKSYAIASFEDITDEYEKELAFKRYKSMVITPENIGKMFYLDYNISKNTLESHSVEFVNPDFFDIAKKGFSSCMKYICEKYICEEYKKSFSDTFSKARLLREYSENNFSGEMDVSVWYTSEVEPIYVRLSYQMIADPFTSDIRLLFSCRLIDKEKRAEIELLNRARRDSVTGIYNRITFSEKVVSKLETSCEGMTCAFIMFDIDHFKAINDTHGHIEGDKVLYNTASIIKSVLEEGDFTGRFGGDEFGIFLENASDIERLKNRLEKILVLMKNEKNLNVSASMGVSIYPRDGKSFEILYKKADVALYKAKSLGRNCYVIFDNSTNEN